MALKGILKLDGEEQKIEAATIGLRLSTSPDNDARVGEEFMGTQITETIAVADGKMTTTVTVKPQNGTATTTTTTTDIDTPE